MKINKGRERLRKSLKMLFAPEDKLKITAPQEETPSEKSQNKRYYIKKSTKKVGSN